MIIKTKNIVLASIRFFIQLEYLYFENQLKLKIEAKYENFFTCNLKFIKRYYEVSYDHSAKILKTNLIAFSAAGFTKALKSTLALLLALSEQDLIIRNLIPLW